MLQLSCFQTRQAVGFGCSAHSKRDPDLAKAGTVTKEEWMQSLHWLYPHDWDAVHDNSGQQDDDANSVDNYDNRMEEHARRRFIELDANKVRTRDTVGLGKASRSEHVACVCVAKLHRCTAWAMPFNQVMAHCCAG